MKMNTFELEQKLHILNKALIEKNSEVVINFTERPEDRAYQCVFTQEFLDDVESLIKNSKDVVIVIEYEHSWSGSLQSDYILTNYEQDWERLWKKLTFDGARPTNYYAFYASDNPLDNEILYKMIKASENIDGILMPSNRFGRPIDTFPFFKKMVDTSASA